MCAFYMNLYAPARFYFISVTFMELILLDEKEIMLKCRRILLICVKFNSWNNYGCVNNGERRF